MKAMRMEFKLVVLQLVKAIRENNYRVLTDIILDYATRLYREKDFTRTKYLDKMQTYSQKERKSYLILCIVSYVKRL